LYAGIRYGCAWVLGKLAVHRGMFHSIPAMLIAAELAFLAFQSESVNVRLLMAGGVAVGFLSHLLLDELYSVEWSGVRVRLNKYAGSAFKLFGKEFLPNVMTYALLSVLSYAALVDAGLLESPKAAHSAKLLRQAFQQHDGGETATQ
ncbi:MAG: metal-dependent hydrolase, partial [Planctomycetes bacterium]|nr:metal-dependent hydrolase [Planctomycetota bacterium]